MKHPQKKEGEENERKQTESEVKDEADKDDAASEPTGSAKSGTCSDDDISVHPQAGKQLFSFPSFFTEASNAETQFKSKASERNWPKVRTTFTTCADPVRESEHR